MRVLSMAMAMFVVSAPAALAEGDAAAGEKVFRRCMACHAVGDGAKNKVGPQLNGVVGRAIGTAEGYSYGAGLAKLAESGLTWDAENMAKYIIGPADYVQEVTGEKLQAKMVAQRLKDDQLADVIAYLDTYNADGSTK